MTRTSGRVEQRLGALVCFDGLNPRELAVVARLVDEIEVLPGRSFGGYPGQEVALVEHGVAVESGVTSSILGPGAVIGPNGATALNRVRLLVIARRALPALLDLAPSLRRTLGDGCNHATRATQTNRDDDWILRAAEPGDNDAIVRLVYGDPLGEGARLLGTPERAVRFGALVASAWPGASWSSSTVVEAQGAVVAVLQDGPSDQEFQPGLTFLRQVLREFGPLTTLRALPGGAALQRVRVSPPHDSWAIHELHVDSRWRNHSIGARLLRHGEHRAREHKFATTALSTRTNNPARRLYERLGYRVVKQRSSPLYAHVTGATGRLLMTKALGPAE